MPITADIKVNGEKMVMENLDKARRTVETEKGRKMEKACQYLNRYIRNNKLRGGKPLRSRSNALRNSFGYTIEGKGDNVIGRVGSRLPYSAVHETGKTIKSKPGRSLVVPQKAALTGTGQLRKPPKQWDNTFVAKGTIFQRKGKKIIPLFLLRKQVVIPARPYIGPAIEETRNRIIDIIGETITTAVKVGNGQ